MKHGETREGSSWEAATWEGARRARLRRALELTVGERLESLEHLAEVSNALYEAGKKPVVERRSEEPRELGA